MPEKVDLTFDQTLDRGVKGDSTSFPIDDDVTNLIVYVDRAKLGGTIDAEIARVSLYVSLKGDDFQLIKTNGFAGGVHVARKGQILPFTTISSGPLPMVRGRKYRLEINTVARTRIKCDCDQLIRGVGRSA